MTPLQELIEAANNAIEQDRNSSHPTSVDFGRLRTAITSPHFKSAYGHGYSDVTTQLHEEALKSEG